MTDNSLNRDVLEYLNDHLPEYIEILRRMVNINSFTTNPDGINQLGDYTAEIFSQIGLRPEHVSSKHKIFGNHLVLTNSEERQDNRPTIALISHLDTVFPPEEESLFQFQWRVDGERIYGPGTIDIKGGTVVIYMLLAAISALYPELFNKVRWVVLLNAAEEYLVPEFGDLCRTWLPADTVACLIFEGGRQYGSVYSIVTARKGMATYRISVEGKGAHAGAAHNEGANAVVQLAHTVAQVAALTDYERGVTFNIGSIEGGTVLNRVPHQASASGEMRAFIPEVLEESLEKLSALKNDVVVRSQIGDYACQIEVEITDKWRPWPPNNGSNSLVPIWQKAASALGFSVQPEERGGLSDGNLLWDFAPTLDGLGPVGGNAHCSERSSDGSKDQEYVHAPSLVPKAALSIVAIRELLEGRIT